MLSETPTRIPVPAGIHECRSVETVRNDPTLRIGLPRGQWNPHRTRSTDTTQKIDAGTRQPKVRGSTPPTRAGACQGNPSGTAVALDPSCGGLSAAANRQLPSPSLPRATPETRSGQDDRIRREPVPPDEVYVPALVRSSANTPGRALPSTATVLAGHRFGI